MDQSKKASPEVTADSVLETITEEHLKCDICLDMFRSPSLLDCNHTFCLSCLEDLRKSNGRSCQVIVCPDCRASTPLRGRGTSGLKSNFAMASLVDQVVRQQRLLRKQQGAFICTLCDEEAHSLIQCYDCNVRLCQDCWCDQESVHGDHDFRVVERKSEDEKVPKCKRHSQLEYAFYCKSCQALICPMCVAKLHRQNEHELQDIEEADNSAREELCILQSRAEAQLREYISKKDDIEGERSYLTDAMAELMTTIKKADAEQSDKMHILKEIREFEAERLLEVSDKLDGVQAYIDCIQNVCDKVSYQLAEADKFELLQRKEELVILMENNLEMALHIPRLPILVEVNVISFDEGYVFRVTRVTLRYIQAPTSAAVTRDFVMWNWK